jgi:uncharacterized protein (TIGR02145 family)
MTTLNGKPIRLKGGSPIGGIYAGPGVNPLAGTFTPSVAGLGLKTLTYSYSNTWSCSGSATHRMRVVPDPFSVCGNTFTDIRDGSVYPTILLGSQCWMAANLNFGGNINAASSQRDNCVPEKYCYNDLGSACLTSGGLYQWDELMAYSDIPASQGLCPPAWHVPTENDWATLFLTFFSNAFAGSPLLYSGYSGFNALISGVEHENREYNFTGFATLMWSSNPHGNARAWAHGMNDYDHSVSYYPSLRSNAFSVRCLRD